MTTRGRKHSPGEKQLLAQVAKVFTARKERFGAKRSAQELNISLASFYNYAAGKDLPRMEVLRDAQKAWRVRWDLIDPSEVLLTRKANSAEQLVFSFLESLRKENVEVVRIGPEGETVLQVTLKIRFSA